MRDKQVIFVFGMARSGTSALSRVLSLCGGALPEQLLGPNHGNPTGHWEPLEALQLNEEFLYSNGSTFYDPSLRLHEEGVVGDADKSAFIDRIVSFFDSCPHDRPLVLKEPRIVGLSDYWFEAARRSGFDAKVVIPVRHPQEVAGSLADRDQASFELSNALWLKYNLLAERSSRHLPRVFVEYSSLLADWEREISRISEVLSVRLDNRDEDAIQGFLTTDLHRHRSNDTSTEAFGHRWIGNVYAALSAAARGADLDTGKLDEVFADYSQSERVFRNAANEFRNRFSGSAAAKSLGGLVMWSGSVAPLPTSFEQPFTNRPIAFPRRSTRWQVRRLSFRTWSRSSRLKGNGSKLKGSGSNAMRVTSRPSWKSNAYARGIERKR
jgi:hypothetical protein